METAIRIMGRFKRARVVSGTARSLTIHNLERLKQLATGLQARHSKDGLLPRQPSCQPIVAPSAIAAKPR